MQVASRRWGSGARVDNVDKGKKRLLRAAITCFVSKGIQATTIEDIANAANVTRRTVYRYYSGKGELVDAIIDLERKRLFGRLHEICNPYQDDFPRMIEECLACAADVLSPAAGRSDLLSGGNGAEALPHMIGEDSLREWFDLFDEPYQTYRAQHPQVGELRDLIEVIGRLVLSFRHVPGEPDAIRQALRAILTLKPARPAETALTDNPEYVPAARSN